MDEQSIAPAVVVNEGFHRLVGSPDLGSALVLVLGAVGLPNISMVTVKYRVREIGIRRSFGATSGRILFGVMMESVVAAFVAVRVKVIDAIRY